jgi:O-antigen ligase
MLPSITFLVISVVAMGMGQIPWFRFADPAPWDAQMGGFAVFVLSAGLMLAAAHRIESLRWLEIIVWVFLGFGFLLVIGKSLSLPFIQFFQRGFTAQSMLWTWLVALSFGQLLFNSRLRWDVRCLLLILIVMTAYLIFIKQNSWKSGWVPPLLAVISLMALRFRRLALFTVPFALVAMLLVAQNSIATDQYSWDTRLDAWRVVLEISKVSPVIGLGFANYYWYAPLFPLRGYYIQFNSHSQYVDIIAQTGILGLLCYLWLFLAIGQLAWRLMNGLPEGFAKAYAYGIFAGLVGCLLAGYFADWLLPFVYNIGLHGFRASILPWMFFGGLIGIEQIYRKEMEPAMMRQKGGMVQPPGWFPAAGSRSSSGT